MYRDRPHDNARERVAVAAHRLYHHAVLCDATHQWETARVMWAKYTEAAARLERGTNLMKNSGRRLF